MERLDGARRSAQRAAWAGRMRAGEQARAAAARECARSRMSPKAPPRSIRIASGMPACPYRRIRPARERRRSAGGAGADMPHCAGCPRIEPLYPQADRIGRVQTVNALARRPTDAAGFALRPNLASRGRRPCDQGSRNQYPATSFGDMHGTGQTGDRYPWDYIRAPATTIGELEIADESVRRIPATCRRMRADGQVHPRSAEQGDLEPHGAAMGSLCRVLHQSKRGGPASDRRPSGTADRFRKRRTIEAG